MPIGKLTLSRLESLLLTACDGLRGNMDATEYKAAGLSEADIDALLEDEDLLVPHMSLEEQPLIEERIQGVDALLRLESDRTSKLGKQKLGLMQDLLTGKVAVKVRPEIAA